MFCRGSLKVAVFIWFSITLLPGLSSANSDSLFLREVQLLRHANKAFCNGDTAGVIKDLEAVSGDFPKSVSASIASKTLAAFYVANGDTARALHQLHRGLGLRITSGFPIIADSCGLLQKAQQATIKAEICVALSSVYQSIGNDSAALRYLFLADSTHLPYRDCANGAIMYRTKLSLAFADFYLHTGDTSKAIARLFRFFLSGESYDDEVTVRLKSILEKEHSTKEIRREVYRAIAAMRSLPASHTDSPPGNELLIFGHRVGSRGHGSISKDRKALLNEPNIKLLLQ